MDYGKLAYQRVEELQASVRSVLKSERTVHRRFTATPYFNMQKGEYVLPTLFADGTVTLLIKAYIRADGELSGKLTATADGITVASEALTLSEGEEREVLIMASPEIDGSAELTLSAHALPCTLTGVHVLISGNGADLSLSTERGAMDKNGGVWAIADGESDEIFVRTFDESTEAFGDKIYIGRGACVDICAYGSGFALCHNDRSGNTFVVFLDSALSVTGRVTLTDNAEACAVGAYGEDLALAEIIEGEVFVRVLSAEGVSAPKKLTVTGVAEELCFVKNASLPSLVVRSSSRSLMLTALKEHGGRESVTLTAQISTEAV